MSEEIKGKRGRKPKSPEAPVMLSVDETGEDLGDVTDQPRETSVIESQEPDSVLSDDLQELLTSPELAEAIQDEIDSEIVAAIIAQMNFKPTLRPSSVKGEPKGPMPVPKGIFDLVTTDAGWKEKIELHVSKHGLKSVAHWQDVNGYVQVRCMSSSKFGEVL